MSTYQGFSHDIHSRHDDRRCRVAPIHSWKDFGSEFSTSDLTRPIYFPLNYTNPPDEASALTVCPTHSDPSCQIGYGSSSGRDLVVLTPGHLTSVSNPEGGMEAAFSSGSELVNPSGVDIQPSCAPALAVRSNIPREQ